MRIDGDYYGHHKPLIVYGDFWEDIMEVIERSVHVRPEEKMVYRIVGSPREALATLRDFDRKYKGSHPRYAPLMSERDFVLQH